MTTKTITTDVIYVRPRDARSVKIALEAKGLLDKRFRMTTTTTTTTTTTIPDGENEKVVAAEETMVALPVVRAATTTTKTNDGSDGGRPTLDDDERVRGRGREPCPLSTSVLGNGGGGGRRSRRRRRRSGGVGYDDDDAESAEPVVARILRELCSSVDDDDDNDDVDLGRFFDPDVDFFDPRRLERLGEDVVVVPSTALRDDATTAAGVVDRDEMWRRVAAAAAAGGRRCRLLVRRGEIDPRDGRRRRCGAGGILWPPAVVVPPVGPDAPFAERPSLATVVEHGVRQSLDLTTRVMFSRGNVTEKERFGKTLVRPGDTVLDLYAGIGYYTLFALVHGRARRVIACEWNPDAAEALRYNLRDNGVSDRCVVVEGDCRDLDLALIENDDDDEEEVVQIDRVVLGLLPSSEGGWATAVRCLRSDVGGTLHVHANVPTAERDAWCLWLVRELRRRLPVDRRRRRAGTSAGAAWSVVGRRVVRVKSFAPRVDHVVADVFVGPEPHEVDARCGFYLEAKDDDDGDRMVFRESLPDQPSPSCALDRNGVLSQEWMMPRDKDVVDEKSDNDDDEEEEGGDDP